MKETAIRTELTVKVSAETISEPAAENAAASDAAVKKEGTKADRAGKDEKSVRAESP